MVNIFSSLGVPNIEKLYNKGDIKGLIKALDYQKDPEIRKAAVNALGRIGNKQTAASICAALKDKNHLVSTAAAEILGKMGDPRVLEPLLQMIGEHDWYLSSAVDALVNIYSHLEDKALQDEMIEKMLLVLNNQDGFQQVGAIDFLYNVIQNDNDNKYNLSVPLANKILEKKCYKKCHYETSLKILANIVEKIDDAELLKSIRTELRLYLNLNNKGRKSLDVENIVVNALGKIGQDDDLKELAIFFIYGWDQPLQKAIIDVMSRINKSKTVAILLKKINAYTIINEEKDCFCPNWIGAIRLLGEIGEPWVIELLIAVLDNDEFGNRRLKAEEALRKMGLNNKIKEEGKKSGIPKGKKGKKSDVDVLKEKNIQSAIEMIDQLFERRGIDPKGSKILAIAFLYDQKPAPTVPIGPGADPFAVRSEINEIQQLRFLLSKIIPGYQPHIIPGHLIISPETLITGR